MKPGPKKGTHYLVGRSGSIYDKNIHGQAFIEDVWNGQRAFRRDGDEERVKILITYVIHRVIETLRVVVIPTEKENVIERYKSKKRLSDG